MENIEKVTGKSMNLIDDNKKKIGELFPEVITESRDSNGELVHAIDFEKLKQLLSDSLTDHNEHYEFTWVGKNKAILEAGTPISKTLRPRKDKSVDWDHTENIYIEGDNLEALKLLQESYLNKIDVIYIDPPYNTGKDFIYNDNFKLSQKEYEEMTNEFDEYNRRMVSSKEDSARFHSDWLSMMYPRLKLARNLLSDDGVIFISIDDNEQAHLKELCDEIFGEENFVTKFVWEKSSHFGRQKKNTYINTELIYVYAKKITLLSSSGKIELKNILVENIKEDFEDAPLYNKSNNIKKLVFPSNTVKFNIPDGIYNQSEDEKYILHNPLIIEDGKNKNDLVLSFKSRWAQKTVDIEIEKGTSFLIKSKKMAIRAVYAEGKTSLEAPKQLLLRTTQLKNKDIIGTTENGTSELCDLMGESVFSYPKPKNLIKYLLDLLHLPSKDMLVLDFFAGSGTTAEAVMELNAEDNGNRKFIMVQLPENFESNQMKIKDESEKKLIDSAIQFCKSNNLLPYLTEIGEERIRRAGAKIKEEHPEVDTGFRVFKIDSSNIKEVTKTPGQVTQVELLEDERNIKEDRNDLDLLYQVMIDWGLELSLPYELEQMNGVSVHNVFDGALIACFADELSESLIRSIAEKHPFRVVFKDSSFKDSAMKANVVQIFKEISPETKIKVL